MERLVESAHSSRVDPASGVREVAEFIDGGSGRLFSVHYIPPAGVRGAVLLCPSILAELLADYSEEVLLARSLAARGIMVRRFHYRGVGHSDGETQEVTLERMCDDATVAADRLRLDAPSDRFGLVGTRVGAFAAASVRSRVPNAPIVLCEPLLEGDRFTKEAVRYNLMQQARNASGDLSSESLIRTIEEKGLADILGYPFTRALRNSLQKRRLLDEIMGDAPVLLVQFSRRGALSGERLTFLDNLNQRGIAAESCTISHDIVWWFASVRRRIIQEIADVVSSWFVGRFLTGGNDGATGHNA